MDISFRPSLLSLFDLAFIPIPVQPPRQSRIDIESVKIHTVKTISLASLPAGVKRITSGTNSAPVIQYLTLLGLKSTLL